VLAHHTSPVREAGEDRLRLRLLRRRQGGEKRKGCMMHRIKGLLPRLEHLVHQVAPLPPRRGPHRVEHGLVQRLHLLADAGDRVRILVPSALLVGGDTELRLEPVEISVSRDPARRPAEQLRTWPRPSARPLPPRARRFV